MRIRCAIVYHCLPLYVLLDVPNFSVVRLNEILKEGVSLYFQSEVRFRVFYTLFDETKIFKKILDLESAENINFTY